MGTRHYITLSFFTALIFLLVIFSGCASSSKITSTTTETTTIQPVKIDIPPVKTELDIPLVKPDTLNLESFGVYEGEKEIENDKGEPTAKAKVKVTIKKNKQGKPVATVNLDIQQKPIEKAAQVTQTKKVENKKEETIGFGEYLKYFFYILLLLAGLSVFAYIKGLLPIGKNKGI